MNRTFIMRECLGKALWLCFCLSIAGCAEDDRMTPLSADSGDTADELIPIHISLTGDNDYHSSSFNNASTRTIGGVIGNRLEDIVISGLPKNNQPEIDSRRHCCTGTYTGQGIFRQFHRGYPGTFVVRLLSCACR